MRMKRIIYVFSIFLLLVLLNACGDSKPSESSAKDYLVNQLKIQDDCASLSSFKKTNGMTPDAHSYVFEYEAIIKINKDNTYWCPTQLSAFPLAGKNKFMMDLQCGGKVLQKNETVKINDIVQFIKTENGWIAQKGNKIF